MVKSVNNSIVEPIESVHTTNTIKIKDVFDSCINCGSDLNADLKCEECGYDRNIVYNLALENKKERERNEAE